ncbi:MAG: TonB family protein [Deltaproteobacteria bacterium]|nr:TonB family protein [Deltaproteobacteria bacterium]
MAVAIHGLLIGSAHVFGLTLTGERGFGHAGGGNGEGGMAMKTVAAAAEPELKPTCVGDAYLAFGGRTTMCFAPWESDNDACISTATTTMWLELSSCMARDEKAIAQVAMLEPKQADKVTPIDPEPLLEMLQPMKPPEQPKPVPEPKPQQQPPPAPPQPPAPKRPMQVVETARPTAEKPPEDTRFLAEYDTHVEKQKVARGSVQEPMVAKSQPAELKPTEQPKEASVKQQEDRPRGANPKAPDVPGSLSMRTPGAQAPAEVEQEQKTRGAVGGATGPLALDGVMAKRGDGAIEQQHHDRSEVPKGQNGAGGGQPDVPNLKPTQEVLERALGGGNVDHLEDVDNGDETALNAKRWVYASFFNRLKRQVAQNWDPQTVWRRIDPTGQVNGFKTRVTEVRVSLSSKGDLAKIVVTNPSGVSDLDDEAVRAFHAAAPFPNPPSGLVDKENLITFAFSFYFEIGGGHTSWRVIRGM